LEDPEYVSRRTLNDLHRVGFPPELNRSRPVATSSALRPSQAREDLQLEAGSYIVRETNVPQRPEDEPIPSIETNYHDERLTTQAGLVGVGAVETVLSGATSDGAPSVTRIRTPSEELRTTWVLRMLSEQASTGETPEAYHRILQTQTRGRNTVLQGPVSRSRSRPTRPEDGQAAGLRQPAGRTLATQQNGHSAPTLQSISVASGPSASTSTPIDGDGGRGRGLGRGRGPGRGRGRGVGRGKADNAAPRGRTRGQSTASRATAKVRATTTSTANVRNAGHQTRERIVDEQAAARAARAAKRALR